MKILVTGSKGVVGKILVEKLKKNNHDVIGCDLLHHPGQIGFTQNMSSELLEYVRCDVSFYRQIERIFSNYGPFDLVYNCAAEFGRWNGEDFFEQLWRSNVVGLKNLLTLQTQYKFKLVHFSSSEVYGDFKDLMKESVMEDFEVKQLNDYAISKWTNEMQISNHEKIYNSENVIVRLFNTYGPGETYHPYRSVNAKFCPLMPELMSASRIDEGPTKGITSIWKSCAYATIFDPGSAIQGKPASESIPTFSPFKICGRKSSSKLSVSCFP